MQETALLNSRCAAHPKHTLAPWYNSRDSLLHGHTAPVLKNSATSHRWEPEPQIPHPEWSTHLSLSQLGTVGIPSRVQDLLFLETKMLETGSRVASSDHLRVPASHPTAWHLILGFSLRCCGLPAAAKIFWSSGALLWGELPGMGDFSAIPVANYQSLSQSYLACLVGTGWIFYLQRPRGTDSHWWTVFISFLFEGTKEITWGKACSLHRRCRKATVAQWQPASPGCTRNAQAAFLTDKILAT